jgi:hypothetical protein
MSPEEEWLDKNTFYCVRLSCHMQPDKCEEYQKTGNACCVGCPQKNSVDGGGKFTPTGKIEKQLKEIKVGKYGKCQGACGRENVQIIGKGLCFTCRKAAINSGTYGVVKTAQKVITHRVEQAHEANDVLGRLLAPMPSDQGMFVPMDDDLYRRVQDMGMMPEDVAVLLLHLLDGHLRWRDEFSPEAPRLAAPAPLSLQKEAQPNGHKEAGA